MVRKSVPYASLDDDISSFGGDSINDSDVNEDHILGWGIENKIEIESFEGGQEVSLFVPRQEDLFSTPKKQPTTPSSLDDGSNINLIPKPKRGRFYWLHVAPCYLKVVILLSSTSLLFSLVFIVSSIIIDPETLGISTKVPTNGINENNYGDKHTIRPITQISMSSSGSPSQSQETQVIETAEPMFGSTWQPSNLVLSSPSSNPTITYEHTQSTNQPSNIPTVYKSIRPSQSSSNLPSTMSVSIERSIKPSSGAFEIVPSQEPSQLYPTISSVLLIPSERPSSHHSEIPSQSNSILQSTPETTTYFSQTGSPSRNFSQLPSTNPSRGESIQSSQMPSRNQSMSLPQSLLPSQFTLKDLSAHPSQSTSRNKSASPSQSISTLSPTEENTIKPSDLVISIPPFPPSPGPTPGGDTSSLLNTITFFVTAGNFSSRMEHFRRTLANLRADFFVHLGEFNDYEKTHCLESAYSDFRDTIVSQSKHNVPVLFTLGDREWVDCYVPTIAKVMWEDYFTESLDREWSAVDHAGLSDLPIITTTGLKIIRDPTDKANFAFMKDRVLFIGLNMSRGEIRGGDDVIEWVTHLEQNRKWIVSQLEKNFSTTNGEDSGIVALVLMGNKYNPLDDAARDFFEQLSLYVTVPTLYVYHTSESFGWDVKKKIVSNQRIWFLGVEDGTFPFMKVAVNVTSTSSNNDGGPFFFTQDEQNNFIVTEDQTAAPTVSPSMDVESTTGEIAGYITTFYVTSEFFLDDDDSTGSSSSGYKEAIADILPDNSSGNRPFLVHLGNIIDPDVTDCEDSYYEHYSETLANYSNVPVYLTVGNRDWEGCIDASEAETFWKAHMLDLEVGNVNNSSNEVTELSFSSELYRVNRQKDQPENFSFFYNDVLFVGLHMTRGGEAINKVRLENNFSWTVTQLRKTIRDNDRSAKVLVMFGHNNVEENTDFFEELSLHIKFYGVFAVYIHHSEDNQSTCKTDGVVANNAIWFCSVVGNILPFLRVEVNTTSTNGDKSPFLFSDDREL